MEHHFKLYEQINTSLVLLYLLSHPCYYSKLKHDKSVTLDVAMHGAAYGCPMRRPI